MLFLRHFIATCFVLLLVTSLCKAQWISDKIRRAPSPDAASLGTYINFPIANNSGLLPVDVPLGELTTETLKVPIQLSYHGSGVRVEDEASSVGMGWSLISGGVITRSVRGSADDINPNIQVAAESYYKTYWGWLAGGKIAYGFPESHWASGYGGFPAQKQAFAIAYMDPASSSDVQDTEPDIFYINAGPLRASFLFDNDGNIRFLTATDYKLSYTAPQYNRSSPCTKELCGIQSFTLVDDSGNIYTFDIQETATTRTEEFRYLNSNPESNFVVVSSYTSSWFLSKISSPNGREITFRYKDLTTKQSPRLLQQRKACVEGNCNVNSGNVVSNTLTTNTKIIESAEDAYVKVSFESSTREDLEGGLRVDAIAIRSLATREIIKRYDLNYFYTTASKLSGNPYLDKRLFLEGCSERASDGTTTAHRFRYDRPNFLPNKLSTEQDFWGYYNGNGSSTLIPMLYVYPALISGERYRIFPYTTSYPGNQHILPGESRFVTPSLITVGSLIEMQFPTGGKAIYKSGPNEFYDAESGVVKGGGIRIEEVKFVDKNDVTAGVKRYLYDLENGKSSGVLTNMPRFARETTYGPNPNKSQGGQPAVFAPTEGFTAYMYERKRYNLSYVFNAETDMMEYDLWNVFTERFSVSRTPLSDLDGQQVSYTRVSVSESGKGSIVNEYYPPRTFKTHPSYVQTASSFPHGSDPCDATGGAGQYSCSDTRLVLGKIEKTGYNITPFPPISMDMVFTYGKLKSKRMYDDEANLKEHYQYEYETIASAGVPVLVRGLVFQAQDGFCDLCIVFRTPIIPRAWSIYSYYVGADAFLKSVTIVRHEGTDSLIERNDFVYARNLKKIKKTTASASDGADRITEFQYPDDYGVDANWSGDAEIQVVREMGQRNILTPLETIYSIRKDGEERVVGGEVIRFMKDGVKILPFEKRSLKPARPLSDFRKSFIDGDPNERYFFMDDRYVVDRSVRAYNSLSLPLEESDRTTTYSYMYGYSDRYVLAVVANAKANQFYYTSFEDGTINVSKYARTGEKSRIGSYSTTITGLTPGSYRLTFWKAEDSKWKFDSKIVTVGSGSYRLYVEGDFEIDEVRLYPENARMTTYTLKPGIGITSIMDESDRKKTYEYDGFGRLIQIKDDDGSLLKKYSYHFRDN